MAEVKAYAAYKAKEKLQPFTVARRELQPHDVQIKIRYCGVCHSDVHQVRDEWSHGIFPMVPGHEILGEVVALGKNVRRYKVGDRVGVGCFVDSCRECSACRKGLEQYCEKGFNATYNSYEKDGKTPTFGGYSSEIVVDENYVLKIPDNLSDAEAAPLMCAGITTYSPLKTWGIKPGDKVGVIGLGGLGHMAVKFAKAMGADVALFSTSDGKEKDAKKFGATTFINTKKSDFSKDHANQFDLLINTVSANIPIEEYLETLKQDGMLVLLGVPETPYSLNCFHLIMKRRRMAGSLIGGIKETQEMLDFCGKHDIVSDVEIIPIEKINEAYDRMIKSDVRYRFVVDMSTL